MALRHRRHIGGGIGHLCDIGAPHVHVGRKYGTRRRHCLARLRRRSWYERSGGIDTVCWYYASGCEDEPDPTRMRSISNICSRPADSSRNEKQYESIRRKCNIQPPDGFAVVADILLRSEFRCLRRMATSLEIRYDPDPRPEPSCMASTHVARHRSAGNSSRQPSGCRPC